MNNTIFPSTRPVENDDTALISSLLSQKPRMRNISQYGFLNNGNHALVAEYMRHISEKVSECLMNKKAIINSEIPLRDIAQSFPIEKFPSIGTGAIDFSNIVLQKGPVVNFGSANFFGQMHPSRNLPAIIASHVSTMLNQNLIAEEVSPVFTQMENQVVGYLADIIGYDTNKAGGSVVSGGTMANRTAMMVARNKILDNVADNGMYDILQEYNELHGTSYRGVQILAGEDNHYSIAKNAGDIGIGRKNVIQIPYKENEFILDIDSLKQIIEQAEKDQKLIIGIFITAGTTEKGHIHDIEGVINIAKTKGQNGREIYVHVDAAHGGGFLVDDAIKSEHFKSIEKAESVTIDGHKMLYTNYNCGCIIFKDKNSQNLLEHSAAYIMDENSDHENHGRYTLEGSRGTGGVFQLWATIQSFGKNGLQTLVRKTLENTQILRRVLTDTNDFEILSGESPLNLICFRYHPEGIDNENDLNELNMQLKERMYTDGNYYIGDTTIDGKKCFRAVPMNLETEETNFIGFIEKARELCK